MKDLIMRFAKVFSAAAALAQAGAISAAETKMQFSPAVSNNVLPMEKYDVITNKNMFKDLAIPATPASSQPAAAPASVTGAFSKDYELKALIDTGISIRAGFFDKKANNMFYLSPGETYGGVDLIFVNYNNEEAVLRSGAELWSFSLRPDKATPAVTSPALSASTPQSPDMPMPKPYFPDASD